MSKYTNEQGQAIINNFQMRLGEYSLIAQTVQGHSTKNPRLYSGIAADLDVQLSYMTQKYGAAITGEAVEEAQQNVESIDNPALFYNTSNEDVNDQQDEYFEKLQAELEAIADNLQAEEQRIEEEQQAEEQRRQEEAENRERARQQAEQALETERKYAAEEAARAAASAAKPSGIIGRVTSFFGQVFGRGRR